MCIKVQDSLVCRDVSGDGVAWWDVGGGLLWEFDLGAWASAVTAIAAIVALYFARKAWIASHGMLVLEEKRESRAEQREVDRLAQAEQAVQADRVAAWVHRDLGTSPLSYYAGVEAAPTYELHIRNDSPLPVYEVRVSLIGLGGGQRGRDYFNLIPPGLSTHPLPEVELWEHTVQTADGELAETQETPDDLDVEIEFRDAAQRRWKRSGTGVLTRKVTATRSTSWKVEAAAEDPK